jgi:hypothetical protein
MPQSSGSSNVPNTLSSSPAAQQMRQWATRILSLIDDLVTASDSGAVASTSSKVRRAVAPVVAPLQKVLATLNGLTEAQTESVKIGQDPMLSSFAKIQQIGPLFTAAGNACQQAIDALQAAVDSASLALTKAILPQRPAGVSDVFVVDAAQRLERLLPSDADNLMEAAVKLLRQALQEGDELTTWLLAGAESPLMMVYKACDWSRAQGGRGYSGFVQDMVRAVALQRRQPGVQGDLPENTGEILRALQAGGPGTLRGAITVANNELFVWRQSMARYMASADPSRYNFPR